MNGRDIGGDADTENDPAFAGLIQGCDLMRQDYRVAQRWQQHGSAKRDPSGAPGDGGEQGDWLMPWLGGDRVAHPDRIITEIFGLFR